MGNSEPQNSKLHIYIQTQKPFYNSGSIINGAVFIQANNNFQFNALYIRLQGDEFCEWFEGSSKNCNKYVGSQNFYTQQHILCKYPDSLLKAGKYLYPFSMEISQNIPGSFQSKTFDAKIKYKLIAYFANFTDSNKRYRYQQPLIIRQPFRQDVSSYQGKLQSRTENLWPCLSFYNGLVKWQAQFMRNVCFQGQKIPITVSCNNKEGKYDIKHIAVNLVQYTFVSANSGVDRIYKNPIDKQYFQNSNVKKGKAVQNLNLQFQVKASQKLAQTAISTLVANYYRLEVQLQISSFWVSNPGIYSPLFIMKKNYKHQKLPSWSKHINQTDFQNKQKLQVFHAPQYWFKKNRNLDLMNFKQQDSYNSQSQHFI